MQGKLPAPPRGAPWALALERWHFCLWSLVTGAHYLLSVSHRVPLSGPHSLSLQKAPCAFLVGGRDAGRAPGRAPRDPGSTSASSFLLRGDTCAMGEGESEGVGGRRVVHVPGLLLGNGCQRAEGPRGAHGPGRPHSWCAHCSPSPSLCSLPLVGSCWAVTSVCPLPSSPTLHLPGGTQAHVFSRRHRGCLRTTLLTSCPSSPVTALCRAHGLSQLAGLPVEVSVLVSVPQTGGSWENPCPVQLCTPVPGIALKQSFLTGPSVSPRDAGPCLKHFWC